MTPGISGPQDLQYGGIRSSLFALPGIGTFEEEGGLDGTVGVAGNVGRGRAAGLLGRITSNSGIVSFLEKIGTVVTVSSGQFHIGGHTGLSSLLLLHSFSVMVDNRRYERVMCELCRFI